MSGYRGPQTGGRQSPLCSFHQRGVAPAEPTRTTALLAGAAGLAQPREEPWCGPRDPPLQMGVFLFTPWFPHVGQLRLGEVPEMPRSQAAQASEQGGGRWAGTVLRSAVTKSPAGPGADRQGSMFFKRFPNALLSLENSINASQNRDTRPALPHTLREAR